MHPIYIWTSDPGTVTHQYTAHWWSLLLGRLMFTAVTVTIWSRCVYSVSGNCILSVIIPDKWFRSILPSSCFHRKLVVFVWVFLHNPGTGWCKQAAGRSTYQDKILFVFVNVFWQKSLIFSIMTSEFGLMFNICLVQRTTWKWNCKLATDNAILLPSRHFLLLLLFQEIMRRKSLMTIRTRNTRTSQSLTI